MQLKQEIQNQKSKILLLGASFDTGNLGVSALAESSIKCINQAWPNPTIYLFGSGRQDQQFTLTIDKKKINIKNIPVRFTKNIFLSNHFLVLFMYAILFKIFRFNRFKNFLIKKNKYLKMINEADIAFDITGGDSFSDIYGSTRFLLDFLRKYLVLSFNKNLIFLPQTYGPFQKKSTCFLAKYILKKSSNIYSRDKKGIEYLKTVLSPKDFNQKVKLIQDLAFILDTEKPQKLDLAYIEKLKKNNITIIGLNISGLLYHGGYTKKNMFKLKVDYIQLIHEIIDFFINKRDTAILLIPHVIPQRESVIESDPIASKKIYDSLSDTDKKRVHVTNPSINQREIKYIIGKTDFFIGSRMHACIGALSQYIPAVGLAYSRKFYGVFETIQHEDHVASMNDLNKTQILQIIEQSFKNRKSTQKQLKTTIEPIKAKIKNILTAIN